LQTTLLGLAIAIILALVAALVGPLLIDWSGYRSIFEAEASHLIGVDMRVIGAIDARLLPSPRLTLHDVEIGGGDDKVAAKSLGIEFALGPLLRGEWHAAELHLSGVNLRLGLDAKGRVKAPNIPINFSPEALSIDQLSIEDSTVTLADAANGGKLVLDKLWFNGKAGSLLGPFSGEGATTVAGELYPFRLSTGRASDDGAIKVHLNVDPVTRPLSLETDGVLAFKAGAPAFDGALKLARPVGIASARAAAVTQPWRISGKLKVTAASALMPQTEFQYGSEEQGFKLTGTAEFKFGKTPRFDGVLSGRQIDVDRVLAASAGQSPPANALRNLAALAAAAVRPSIPVSLGVGIDRITLGGSTVENLRGDISSDAGGWSIDRFEFRAPGFANVRLSGELSSGASGATFKGPAEIQAGDPRAFAAWIEGREPPKQNELRPLHLRGDIALSPEKLAVDRLTTEFDNKAVNGRLVYAFAADKKAAKLEADITAPELDVDAVLDFGKALVAGSNLQRPQDMIINADVGHATFAGIDARNAVARVKVDGNGLQIDRLSVADLGGNAFSASGRIDTGGHLPHGALALDIDAKQPAAIAAVLGKAAPQATHPLAALFGRIGRGKLHAALDVSEDGAAAAVRLALTGDLDATHVDGSARLRGDWAKRAASDVHIDGSVDAADAATLFKLIGLERIAPAGKGAGRLALQLAGASLTDLGGTLQLSGSGLTVNSRLRYAGARLNFDDIEARLGEASVRGRLAVGTGSSHDIDGALDTDMLAAADVLAPLVGAPLVAGGNGGQIWSSAPFAAGLLGDVTGALSLKAQRATIAPRLTLREFHTMLRFGKDAVTFDDIGGDIAGGHLSGRLALRATDDGMAAHGKIMLAGADIANLLPAAARPPLTGTVDVAADVEGVGFSPAALIGSLHGSGHIALSNGQVAQLDPRAFDIVERAVDNGLAPDSPQFATVVARALDSGRFPVKQVTGDLVFTVGQARLGDAHIQDNDAALSVGGGLDLTDGTLDARLVLARAAQAGATSPEIYVALHGPLAAPTRSIDASAFTGWLTLHQLDIQSKRLKAIERAAQSAPPPAPPPKKKEAPALPAPLNIKPVPAPYQAPQPSFDAQH